MKFLMLVVTDMEPESDLVGAPSIDDWGSYVDAHGHWIAGDRLRPAAEATTVRVRGGHVVLTGGSAADPAGHIVGFDVLECADLDQAIEIARRHPNAYSGHIELRPFWPLGDD